MKGLIVYKGRYGATMQYAIWLGAALQAPVTKPENITAEQIASAQYVVIGTSVYIGQLEIKEWLHNHARLLDGKKLIFFIVAGSAPGGAEKLRTYYDNCVPAGLRKGAAYFFLPGSLNFRLLSLKDKILLRAGAWLAARRGEKISISDYNHVSREHLAPVIAAAAAIDTTLSNPQNVAV